jgi:hypothetical protein
MGPSPGRLGIPGGQKLKSTKLQMAEEETKEAWRANDVLKEHVEEIREETKSKIDGLMEEIDLLKWMMAQTIAANNKTKVGCTILYFCSIYSTFAIILG